MAHLDIRILFKLAGKPFAAIGFLLPGEESIPGREAMARLHASGLHICDDARFVWDHRNEIPVKNYWLVTGEEHDPVYFVFLYGIGRMSDNDWSTNAFGLKTPWREDVLVLVDLTQASDCHIPWTSTPPRSN